MSSQPSYFAAVGDAGHAVTLLSTLAFAVAVGVYAGDLESTFLFDRQWKADGFCVSGKEAAFWTSHDLCLYVDLAMAALLGLLYLLLKSTKGLEGANKYIVPNIFGIAVHGIGHGNIARNLRYYENKDSDEDNFSLSLMVRMQEESFSRVVSQEAPLVIFWVGLVWASMPQSKKSLVILVSILAYLGQQLTTAAMVFTYVQTVLILSFSLNQTRLETQEKSTYFYAIYPLVVSFPTTLVGWIESTQCSSFVREKFYGHLIYDGYIAVSMVVWYLMCYIHVRSKGLTSMEAKKAV